MTVTSLGLIYILAVTLGSLGGVLFGAGARGLIWSASIGFAFYDSALLIAGGFGIPGPYVATSIILAYTLLIRRKSAVPETRIPYVAGLWAVCALVTFIGPLLFAGTPVFASGVGLDEQVNSLTPLSFTVSNLAQVLYLSFNLLLVGLMARDNSMAKTIVDSVMITSTIAAAAAIALSFAGTAWPHELFDNNPRNFYAVDDVRLRAHLAEPSHLGLLGVTIAAFWLLRKPTHPTMPRRTTHLLFASVGLTAIVYSQSGTAVIATAIAVLVFTLAATARATSGHRIHPGTLLFCIATTGIALFYIDDAWTFAAGIVAEKQGSTSLSNRSFADLHALRVALDTWGIGVGLGSNRASSLATMLLSSIGIVGTYLFFRLCIHGLLSAWHASAFHLAGGLFAVIAAMVISTADFTNPLLWTLLGASIAVTAAHETDRPDGRADVHIGPRTVQPPHPN